MISVKLDVRLICPECGEENLLPRSKLAVGQRVGCEHCEAALRLSHYREIPEEPPIWRLETCVPVEEETWSI
jgi:hypothetical protein